MLNEPRYDLNLVMDLPQKITVKDVVEAVGVSGRTVCRRIKSPDFQYIQDQIERIKKCCQNEDMM
jgi:hypothetical protein